VITDDWLFLALYLVFLFSFFYEEFDCFDGASKFLDSLYLTLFCSLSTVENHGLFLFHNGHRLPARFFGRNALAARDRQRLATLMCGIPACHYSMISVFFWVFLSSILTHPPLLLLFHYYFLIGLFFGRLNRSDLMRIFSTFLTILYAVDSLIPQLFTR
jgi:hypothetical protein